VIPARQTSPQPRAHDGYEWRLDAGEAAEFDTQIPHWFGSTGEGAAEVLSIFGRPGERIVVRARSRREEPPG
jgi:hypothetical protein